MGGVGAEVCVVSGRVGAGGKEVVSEIFFGQRIHFFFFFLGGGDYKLTRNPNLTFFFGGGEGVVKGGERVSVRA